MTALTLQTIALQPYSLVFLKLLRYFIGMFSNSYKFPTSDHEYVFRKGRSTGGLAFWLIRDHSLIFISVKLLLLL